MLCNARRWALGRGSTVTDKLRDVVQASNPTLPRLKIGNGESANPIIQFLVLVIPPITGKRPKRGAVRQLQRKNTGDKLA